MKMLCAFGSQIIPHAARTPMIQNARYLCQLNYFPNSSPELAAQFLRDTLYYLRRALGNFLGMDADKIGLAPKLQVWADAAEFQTAARNSTFDELTHALELYRGAFLDKPIEGWAMLFAQQMDDAYVDVLRRVVALAETMGAPERALDAAQCWVTREPWAQVAHNALIAAHIARGDRAAAELLLARAHNILQREGADFSAERWACPY